MSGAGESGRSISPAIPNTPFYPVVCVTASCPVELRHAPIHPIMIYAIFSNQPPWLQPAFLF
jgi:hypothetical protein